MTSVVICAWLLFPGQHRPSWELILRGFRVVQVLQASRWTSGCSFSVEISTRFKIVFKILPGVDRQVDLSVVFFVAVNCGYYCLPKREKLTVATRWTESAVFYFWMQNEWQSVTPGCNIVQILDLETCLSRKNWRSQNPHFTEGRHLECGWHSVSTTWQTSPGCPWGVDAHHCVHMVQQNQHICQNSRDKPVSTQWKPSWRTGRGNGRHPDG